jgi:hypothetical protein
MPHGRLPPGYREIWGEPKGGKFRPLADLAPAAPAEKTSPGLVMKWPFAGDAPGCFLATRYTHLDLRDISY